MADIPIKQWAETKAGKTPKSPGPKAQANAFLKKVHDLDARHIKAMAHEDLGERLKALEVLAPIANALAREGRALADSARSRSTQDASNDARHRESMIMGDISTTKRNKEKESKTDDSAAFSKAVKMVDHAMQLWMAVRKGDHPKDKIQEALDAHVVAQDAMREVAEMKGEHEHDAAMHSSNQPGSLAYRMVMIKEKLDSSK